MRKLRIAVVIVPHIRNVLTMIYLATLWGRYFLTVDRTSLPDQQSPRANIVSMTSIASDCIKNVLGGTSEVRFENIFPCLKWNSDPFR